MRNKAFDIISFFAPNQKIRGSFAFSCFENIINIKAFFPNMDNDDIFQMYSYVNNSFKYNIKNIIRLSDVERRGYRIKGINKDNSVELREYSPLTKSEYKDLYFDISSTTLPLKLSNTYAINNFELTQEFIDTIIDNYKKNTGFDLQENSTRQAYLNFASNTIYYAQSNSIEEKLESIIKAVAISSIVKNQIFYDRILADKNLQNSLKLQIVLATNAIFISLGLLPKTNAISEEYKKQYIWGISSEDAFRNVSLILDSIKKILEITEVQSAFNTTFLHQQEAKINRQIEQKISQATTVDLSVVQELKISEGEYRQLKQRTLDELHAADPLPILEALNIDVKASSNNMYSFRLDGGNSKNRAENVFERGGVWYAKSHRELFRAGTIESLVAYVKGYGDLSNKEAYKEVLQFCLNTLSVRDYLQEKIDQKKNLSHQIKATNKTGKPLSKEEQLALNKEFLIDEIKKEFGDTLHEAELLYLKKSSIEEIAKWQVSQRESMVKEKEYQPKEKPAKFSDSSSIPVKITAENITKGSLAHTYLTQKRGYRTLLPEIKLVRCFYTPPNEKPYTLEGVGIINNSGGVDLKIFKSPYETLPVGSARSAGTGDITVLNAQNLNKPNPNFITVESQWDLAAFCNDPIGREVYDNSVSVILNGASMAEKAIVYINKVTKDKEHFGLIILGQCDNVNQEAMRKVFLNTKSTIYTKFWYTDEEMDSGKKPDINDKLKDGTNLSTRFAPMHLSNFVDANSSADKSKYEKTHLEIF